LDPLNYLNFEIESPLDSINNKWFINFSHCKIPEKVQCLLQLGQNFSTPNFNMNNNIIQLIKNIENNIIKLDPDIQKEIRNRSVPLIHNLMSTSLYGDTNDRKIIQLINITNNFIKMKPNIIYTRADKGNITVALNRTDYINELEKIFSDKDTYELIKKDPIIKLTNETRCLLAGWKSKGYISKSSYYSIYCSDGTIPRAYGLPKVHKPGFTFRVIISSIDSPTYKLAYFLHKIISNNIMKPPSRVENSFQLIKELKGINIDSSYELISLDVVSLFTNIPITLALEGIARRWEQIKSGTNIPMIEFIQAVKMILDSCFLHSIIRYISRNSVCPWALHCLPLLLI